MHHLKEYEFVGNKDLLKLLNPELEGTIINFVQDIENWISKTKQKPDFNSEITATFVIDTSLKLRVNHHRSEHVVCAGGKPVFSAGEITFELTKNKVKRISQITNQSTGYCPSPKSWNAVKQALDKIGIEFPDYFTTEFVFRICNKCGWINVIKDNYYFCVNCNNQFTEYED